MKTLYSTHRHTTVSRVTIPTKSPAPDRHKATLDIIGDGPTVLIDGLVPLSLARQVQALVELHNKSH